MSDATYRLLDETGALLYVGYSTNLIRRMGTHQARDWWPEVRTITWTEHPDRQTALNEERRQILEDAPRYNQAVYWTIGGKTKIRGFRVTDELWEDAQRVAKARGEDVSAEVRASLERYVRRNRDLLSGSDR